MKTLQTIAQLLLLTTLVGCEEPSEVYYTVTYPIVRVEAVVTTEKVNPDAKPPKVEMSPEEIEDVKADVLANIPMKIGGSYKLDFSRFDGGRIEVQTSAEAEPLPGVFIKRPGQTELRFIYGELGAQDYTYSVDSYSDDGKSKAMLVIDLSQYYKEKHPTWNIATVQLREYTSTPSK